MLHYYYYYYYYYALFSELSLSLHSLSLSPSYAVLLIEKGDQEGQAQVLSAALEVCLMCYKTYTCEASVHISISYILWSVFYHINYLIYHHH